MEPNEPTKGEKVDITRLPRSERRRIGKHIHGKVMGRNLPYVKDSYTTLENFNKIRKEELEAEAKQRGN